jgi:hypothetical protein
MNSVREFKRVIGWQITGADTTAFGLDLKDVALTLSLLAAPSAFAGSAFLVGCAPAPDPEGFVVVCVVLLDCCAAGCDFLPLKGGID